MSAMSSHPPATAPKMSPRRARTRARLIEAATQVIGEKGFFRTTLDEVAARAGLTKGAIYDNFDSKDALFLAAVGTAQQVRSERFKWPKGRDGTVKERLRRLARAVLDDEPAARLEAPMRAEFLLYTLTHEDMRARMAVHGAERFRMTRDRLLKLFAPEELPVSPDRFAILLEALIPGLIFVRAQTDGLVTDDDIIAVFEALA